MTLGWRWSSTLKSLKSPFCWFVAFVSGGSFKPCFCITLLNSYLYLEITDFRNWMIHNIYNPDNPHFWLDFWIDLFISKPHTYIYIHIYIYIYHIFIDFSEIPNFHAHLSFLGWLKNGQISSFSSVAFIHMETRTWTEWWRRSSSCCPGGWQVSVCHNCYNDIQIIIMQMYNYTDVL